MGGEEKLGEEEVKGGGGGEREVERAQEGDGHGSNGRVGG